MRLTRVMALAIICAIFALWIGFQWLHAMTLVMGDLERMVK